MWSLLLLLGSAVFICTEIHAQTCEGSDCLTKKRSVDGDLAACTPGSKWHDECNRCVCTDNGRTICTNWPCYSQNPDDVSKNWGTRICYLGEIWKRNCNICMCTGFGRVSCTEHDCNKDSLLTSLEKKLRSKRSPEENCTPGATWKEDCNTCFCTENGVAGCTMMACAANIAAKDNEQGLRCTPGTTWKEDCNTCFCSDNGNVGCTLMACLTSHSSSHRFVRDTAMQCVPGTTWKEDCNTCFCTDHGHVGCTLMLCPPKHYVKLYGGKTKRETDIEAVVEQDQVPEKESSQNLEKNCEPGKTVQIDCNICYCTELGLACTRRLCHGLEIDVTID